MVRLNHPQLGHTVDTLALHHIIGIREHKRNYVSFNSHFSMLSEEKYRLISPINREN